MQYLKFKTQNQIYADFINLIKTGLNELQIFDWQVKQLYSPFQTEQLEPTIFLTIVSNLDYGAQYMDYKTRISKQKKELTIRFSATRDEVFNDTVNTYNPLDILTALNDFVRSDIGINTLKNMGYAQYKSQVFNVENFIDDDEDFKTLPSFNCTYLYTNEFNYPYKKLDSFDYKIYKV